MENKNKRMGETTDIDPMSVIEEDRKRMMRINKNLGNLNAEAEDEDDDREVIAVLGDIFDEAIELFQEFEECNSTELKFKMYTIYEKEETEVCQRLL